MEFFFSFFFFYSVALLLLLRFKRLPPPLFGMKCEAVKCLFYVKLNLSESCSKLHQADSSTNKPRRGRTVTDPTKTDAWYSAHIYIHTLTNNSLTQTSGLQLLIQYKSSCFCPKSTESDSCDEDMGWILILCVSISGVWGMTMKICSWAQVIMAYSRFMGLPVKDNYSDRHRYRHVKGGSVSLHHVNKQV